MSDDDFFIGWSEQTPRIDRRFFLGLGLSLTAGAGALGAALGAFQRGPGNGQWDFTERDWHGRVYAEPFPVLRSRDVDGSVRSLWLVCAGKCGVAAQMRHLDGRTVTVRGSLLSRDGFYMISASEGADWISEAAPADGDAELDWPAFADVGAIEVPGEILDVKCYFGAMRPSTGKTHKACASLCIRGGIPPALFVRDRAGRRRVLLLVDGERRAHGAGLLPLVADPVTVAGRVLTRAGTLFLAAPVAAITRR